MESETPFDLNRAIQAWRENLAQSPALRSENLDELESHLRDSIATLQGRGLSTDESFLIATRRAGSAAGLEAEFRKVNRSAIWLDRFFWMLIGYQAWSCVAGVIGLISRNALCFGLNSTPFSYRSYHYLPSTALFTLVQLAGFIGSLALCRWLFCRKGQRLGRRFEPWLQHRSGLTLMFATLYLGSVSVQVVATALYALLRRSVDSEKFGDIIFSQSISGAITGLITTAVFAWLTLYLARKRLRPCRP